MTEPKHIADEFVKYFSKFETLIKSDIAQSSDVIVGEGFIDERGSGNAMVVEPCTTHELKTITKTNKSNSAGIDGLSLKALKL